MPRNDQAAIDLAIVGGGLSGSLVALALAARAPHVRVALIDPAPSLGGSHIWSFFDTDVAPRDRDIVAPLISHHWDAYDVSFPARQRTIATGYNSVRSANLDKVVRAALPPASIVAGAAVVIEADKITLADQRRITARAVLDARGPADMAHFRGGWQKFVGRQFTLAAPHGLTRPVIMDATVEQIDGYRFVYLLPFAPNEIFIEDTYYSDGSTLDAAALEARIRDYAAQRGWDITGTSYHERGVLPVVTGGDLAAYLSSSDADTAIGRIGLGGALFHGVTSFSLPDAVRTASAIADAWTADGPLDGAALALLVRQQSRARWAASGLYRLLNRMLFKAAEPDQRYRILEHFHRLPQPVIERFYAGQTSVTDSMRILSGRPPVAIGRAVKAMLDPS
jgi:lycopene beta-cyclase